MPTKTFAGTAVEVNDEGFFVEPDQWTKEMAPEIAEEVGVPTPLTDRHWVVIDLMRSEYFDKGTGPTVRKISKAASSAATRPTRWGTFWGISVGPQNSSL